MQFLISRSVWPEMIMPRNCLRKFLQIFMRFKNNSRSCGISARDKARHKILRLLMTITKQPC
eukprot:6858353-Karenia_brevis.AAC.1